MNDAALSLWAPIREGSGKREGWGEQRRGEELDQNQNGRVKRHKVASRLPRKELFTAKGKVKLQCLRNPKVEGR